LLAKPPRTAVVYDMGMLGAFIQTFTIGKLIASAIAMFG
jgi:hypothetical protein